VLLPARFDAQRARSGRADSGDDRFGQLLHFTALRVQPALGRGFLPKEDKTPGAHPVVVLSYGLWQRGFWHGRQDPLLLLAKSHKEN